MVLVHGVKEIKLITVIVNENNTLNVAFRIIAHLNKFKKMEHLHASYSFLNSVI